MASLFGHIGPFDESAEQWSSYTERFECFVVANKIKPDVVLPIFLSVMGGKTYNLLRSLVQPAKPRERESPALTPVPVRSDPLLDGARIMRHAVGTRAPFHRSTEFKEIEHWSVTDITCPSSPELHTRSAVTHSLHVHGATTLPPETSESSRPFGAGREGTCGKKSGNHPKVGWELTITASTHFHADDQPPVRQREDGEKGVRGRGKGFTGPQTFKPPPPLTHHPSPSVHPSEPTCGSFFRIVSLEGENSPESRTQSANDE
ncbi:hypothetical protein AOLI_G00013230 [Acnodon oligacanthus]